MADTDIIQQLGFEASSAISEINRLSKALNTLNASLKAVGGSVRNWNTYSKNISNNINKTKRTLDQHITNLNKVKKTQESLVKDTKPITIVSDSANKNLNNLSQNIQQVKKHTKSLTISWETLVRVVSTRLAIGGVNLIIRSLAEGTRQAIEFGIRLAEIGTIAGKNANLDLLRNQLIEISRLTGRGLTDVAEGFYQTLSNQVGNATQSMQVFEQAAKLSIATNSTLADSVNLLTAALNGWQLGASNSELVAGKLFKTVELGRLRVSDLADILGMVGPLASEMGVSLEDSLASIANMTVQGTRATKAITQLRAIMTQLIKPTAALQELMEREWGVKNAKQAIVMFGGLNETLFELDKISGGASDELAEFFTNVRALSGVSAQIANLDKTRKALKGLREEGEGLIDWASGLVLDTPAKKAEKAFNELKIELEEVGNSLIPVATLGAKALSFITKEADAIASALVGLPILLVASNFSHLTAALKSASMAGKVFRSSLMGIGYAAAFVIGWELGQWLTGAEKRMKEFVKTNMEANNQITEMVTRRVKKEKQLQEEAMKKQLQASTKYFAALQLKYNEQSDKAKEVAESSKKLAKEQLGNLLSLQENLVNNLAQIQTKSQQKIEAAYEASINTRREMDQQVFDWNLEHLDSLSQAFVRTNRSKELVAAGLAQLSRRGLTDKQLDDARELINLGLQQAKQASSEAAQTQDARQARVALYRTRQQELAAQQALIAADERTIALSVQQAREAEIRHRNQLKNLSTVQELIEKINKGISDFDETGKPKEASQRIKDRENAEAAFKQLKRMFSKPEMMDLVKISDWFDLGDLGRKLAAQARTLPVLEAQLNINYEEQKKKLKDISDKIPMELTATLKFLGYDIEMPADVTQAIEQFTDKVKQGEPELENIEKLMRGVRVQLLQWSSLMQRSVDISKIQTQQTKDIIFGYKKIASESKSIQDLTFVPGSGDIEKLRNYRNELALWLNQLEDATGLAAGISGKGVSAEEHQNILQMVDVNTVKEQLEILTQLDQQLNDLESADYTGSRYKQLQTDAQRLKGILDYVGTKGQKPIKLIDDTQIGQIKNTIETMQPTAFLDSFKLAKNIIEGISNTVNNMKPISISGQVGGYSKGGLIKYFDNGGFIPRGTDTVPAMLTPGEFVMNRNATRKFYSELVAMNAGIKPIYKQTGGDVTTYNVGDINMNITGKSMNEVSARKFATAVKRELRKKTMSF